MDIMDHLWRWTIEKSITTLIIVPVLGYISWVLFRYIVQLSLQAWLFVRSRRRALEAVGREVNDKGACEGLAETCADDRSGFSRFIVVDGFSRQGLATGGTSELTGHATDQRRHHAGRPPPSCSES